MCGSISKVFDQADLACDTVEISFSTRDDPRFPTVRGVLRRGMTVEGLKQFIAAQVGVFFSSDFESRSVRTSFHEVSVKALVAGRFVLLKVCSVHIYCFNNINTCEQVLAKWDSRFLTLKSVYFARSRCLSKLDECKP